MCIALHCTHMHGQGHSHLLANRVSLCACWSSTGSSGLDCNVHRTSTARLAGSRVAVCVCTAASAAPLPWLACPPTRPCPQDCRTALSALAGRFVSRTLNHLRSAFNAAVEEVLSELNATAGDRKAARIQLFKSPASWACGSRAAHAFACGLRLGWAGGNNDDVAMPCHGDRKSVV